jgi:molybdopterin synthase catalytic subunit
VTVSSIADWVSVSSSPLSSDDLVAWAVRPECGAVVTFCGTARSSSTTGHEIQALEYETSVELAEARIAEVVASARSRWPELGAVAIHHRVGVVALTEPAVVIAVSSPHRLEAFEAAQFCIDTVKRCVPMWKREIWEGGSAWSEEAQPIASIDDV